MCKCDAGHLLSIQDKVPDNLDAIVIGSGIGGLSVAALLSKVGQRVLVLEQHDVAGGCTHTFSDKGWDFLHYYEFSFSSENVWKLFQLRV